jgi:peptide/nickel transport system ATP-binding protein
VTPLLELRDLRVHIPTEDGVVKAVDGVSYTVEEGHTLGVVGESGSGKSVSALTVMGLTKASGARISGEVLWRGEDLLKVSEKRLREVRGDEIAMIFQDPLSSLHPFYKVGSQIMEGIRAHRDVSKAAARDKAIDLLELVGIPDPHKRVDQYPHEFSGGMRQRAMIAMALSNDPKLLIADEPTTALDVTVQAQILSLMESLQKETGTAIMIITHDLGVVAEMSDEIVVMYSGRVVERAPTTAIFAEPQHPYTWGLLGSIPRLTDSRDEELVPISGRPPSLINPPSGCHFSPRCPYVRESHTRVDPDLVKVAGSDQHLVRCLLSETTRRNVWRELRAGRKPAEVREHVKLESDVPPEVEAKIAAEKKEREAADAAAAKAAKAAEAAPEEAAST